MSKTISSTKLKHISYKLKKAEYDFKDSLIEGYDIEIIINYCGNIVRNSIFINKELTKLFTFNNGGIVITIDSDIGEMTLKDYIKTGIELGDTCEEKDSSVYIKISPDVVKEIRDFVIPYYKDIA